MIVGNVSLQDPVPMERPNQSPALIAKQLVSSSPSPEAMVRKVTGLIAGARQAQALLDPVKKQLEEVTSQRDQIAGVVDALNTENEELKTEVTRLRGIIIEATACAEENEDIDMSIVNILSQGLEEEEIEEPESA